MKNIPFTKSQIQSLTEKYPTPFYVYDKKAIVKNARELYEIFSWVKGFKNYFAVKGLPNPSILELLKNQGHGADCSSLGEMILAEKVGLVGEEIMITSNDTTVAEYEKAAEIGAIINFDDISHIKFYEKNVGKLPELVCFRYNPGPLKGGNAIIGEPKEAKYGLTTDQMFEAYRICKSKGVKRFGMHTMVCSGEMNEDYFVETIDILFSLAGEIYEKEGIIFDFINIGGGIGIPYLPNKPRVNVQYISDKMKKLYQEKLINKGHPEFKIVMELSRYITGPYGYLVTTVLHEKNTYKDYIGVDACMANLMRPALYGAYHHISILGRGNEPVDHKYDITGSLCENNDKFAINRMMPKINIGDILVIHDAGAHGHAMGFQYNAKLRSAEFLLKKDGSFEMIRRAETYDDYFATLNF